MKAAIITLVVALLFVQGCRTVAGAGQDITWLAEKLETTEQWILEWGTDAPAIIKKGRY